MAGRGGAVPQASGAAVEEEIISRASSGTQKLPMLDVIFTGIASNLTSSLKSRLGLLAEVEMGEVSYTSWGKMIGSLDPYEICVVSGADPWETGFIVTIDPALFYAIYEIQLSGRTPPAESPRRHPTMAEKRIARRFTQVFLDEMSASFNRVSSVSFDAENVETTQQAASLQSAHNSCVIARVSVRIDEVEGHVNTVIPISSLDAVQDQLSKMFLGENFEGDVIWRDLLGRRVKESSVEVQAVLQSCRVPVVEVLDWKPGHVVELGDLDLEGVVVTCAGIPVLKAAAGHRRQRISLRILGEYDESARADLAPEEFSGSLGEGA